MLIRFLPRLAPDDDLCRFVSNELLRALRGIFRHHNSNRNPEFPARVRHSQAGIPAGGGNEPLTSLLKIALTGEADSASFERSAWLERLHLEPYPPGHMPAQGERLDQRSLNMDSVYAHVSMLGHRTGEISHPESRFCHHCALPLAEPLRPISGSSLRSGAVNLRR